MFLEKRRCSAVLAGIRCRMVKVKQGQDQAKVRKLFLILNVPLTSEMREQLPLRIQPALEDGEDAMDGLSISKIEVIEERAMILRFYAKSDFKSKKPIVVLPNRDDSSCNVRMTGIIISTSGGPVARLVAESKMDEAVWAWGANNFGDIIVVEMDPEQKDLPMLNPT